MEKRVKFFDQNTEEEKVEETFGKGRNDNLKGHIYHLNKMREMKFWSEARTDGLVARKIHFGKKVIETYKGRKDQVVYQSATFSSGVMKMKNRATLFDGERNSYLKKMTRKYERNRDIAADRDVYKWTLHLEEKKIDVIYQKEEGKIISSSRVYTKDGKMMGFQADPFSKKPTSQELYEDYQRFSLMEKEVLQQLRDNESETEFILEERRKEEKDIQLFFSIYDVEKRKKKKTQNPQDEEDLENLDFVELLILSELRKLQVKMIDHKNAKVILDSCLKTYKERMKQKEKLIQTRLEKEVKSLKKKQMLANRREMDNQEELTLQETISSSKLRKRILEQRLFRHHQQEKTKLKELKEKIQNSPQLIQFLGQEQ